MFCWRICLGPGICVDVTLTGPTYLTLLQVCAKASVASYCKFPGSRADLWRLHLTTHRTWMICCKHFGGVRYHSTPSEVLCSPCLSGSELLCWNMEDLYSIRQVVFGCVVYRVELGHYSLTLSSLVGHLTCQGSSITTLMDVFHAYTFYKP